MMYITWVCCVGGCPDGVSLWCGHWGGDRYGSSSAIWGVCSNANAYYNAVFEFQLHCCACVFSEDALLCMGACVTCNTSLQERSVRSGRGKRLPVDTALGWPSYTCGGRGVCTVAALWMALDVKYISGKTARSASYGRSRSGIDSGRLTWRTQARSHSSKVQQTTHPTKSTR